MLVKTVCPQCGRNYQVADDHQGKRLKCSQCGQAFTLAVSLDETHSPRSTVLAAGRSQLSEGQRLGIYQIVRKLGAGAMGEVWLAHDAALDRDVAIKVLPAEFAPDQARRDRFLREGKAAARLDHPHIATVYFAGEEAGTAFIAMQYIDGGSLDQAALGGPMPWRDATRVICEAAKGLAAAHQIGLVHRDVKPSNLMRTGSGVTKVVDFGLARATEGSAQLTQQGTLLGTPAYLAPEVWMNQEADRRSDVYALACTYYYLLTGQVPFDGSNLPALGYQHRYEPFPDPRHIVPKLPDGICRILACAAAKAANDRYPTAAEMAMELEVVLATPDQSHVYQSAPSTLPPQTTLGGQAGPLSPPLIDKVSQPAVPRSSRRRRPRVPAWVYAVAASAALAVTLALFLFINTRPGQVKIELSDPSADVQVLLDGDEIKTDGLEEPLTLPVGKHRLIVKSDAFETVTKSFSIKRGEIESVAIALNPKRAVADTPSAPPLQTKPAAAPAEAPNVAETPNLPPTSPSTSTANSQPMAEALQRPTSYGWKNVPLDRWVDSLKDYHKIEIQLDLPALKEAQIDPQTRITTDVKRMPLQSVLNQVLRDLGLTHAVVGDVLLVTTPKALARMPAAAPAAAAQQPVAQQPASMPRAGGGGSFQFGFSTNNEPETSKPLPPAAIVRANRPTRWMLDFQSNTAGEHCLILESLGMEVAIPATGDTWIYYPKPSSAPTSSVQRKLATEARLYWVDERATTISGVASVLKIQPSPKFLVYFLPPELEDRMLQLELAYGDLQEQAIKLTRFEAVKRTSGYDVVVKAQDAK